MTVDFKYLELIKDVNEKVDFLIKSFESRNEKRWLSTKELSNYLDYSEDRIHKLKGVEFMEGVHYHKTAGKLLFDITKIDNWVMGITTEQSINTENYINELFDDILTSNEKNTTIAAS